MSIERVGCSMPAFLTFTPRSGSVKGVPVHGTFRMRCLRQKQEPLAVSGVLGDKAVRCTGGKTIVIVQPADQPKFFAALDGIPDQVQKFVRQVYGIQPGTRMNIHPAEAHLLKYGQLFIDQLSGDFTIPAPERNAAVMDGGVAEQLRA